MDKFQIREINKDDPLELEVVTNWCMKTVLETIPEFEGKEELAKKNLSNFTFEQMSEMIQNDFDDPDKKIVVALKDSEIVGQAIYSVKVDEPGHLYGFCYSRYVEPSYRRKGIASNLMEYAIEWFKVKNVKYIYAQTHTSNLKLQGLFKKFGFTMSGPFQGRWDYYDLKKELLNGAINE